MSNTKELTKKKSHTPLSCVVESFERGIIEHLRIEKSGDLYILSDFYELCCDLLNLTHNTGEYWKNKRKIQYRLKKMKDKGLIDWRRRGTGFIGKTDFGMTSLNSYTLSGFWD